MHREGYRDALALHAESQLFDNEEVSENQNDTEEEDCPWTFSEKSKYIPTSTTSTIGTGDYNRVCFFLK